MSTAPLIAGPTTQRGRPNLVFVFADQLRADVLPAYGGTAIQTPHLDRLQAQAVRLEHMVSTCPVCTP